MTQYFKKNTRWQMLTNQGHIYMKKPKAKNKWKCIIPECPGVVAVYHTNTNFSVLHNHAEDYDRIATEFIKEKIIEWGTCNYKVRETKHLDIIYECLSQNILNYMPEKYQIMRLIRNKRKSQHHGQPHQREFIFSLNELNDFKVAEALSQSYQQLCEYYIKHGTIQPSNPIYDNQQQENFETPNSMIGVTVPEYSLESFCNNTFEMFHIDNNNVINSYQLDENDGSTMNNAANPQASDELASFTVNFDNSNNGNNCQDSSSSVQALPDASVNGEFILSHPDIHENTPKPSRLEKVINRLYQRQQQQCSCVTNTNDYENLHQSSLGQTYCSLNVEKDMVDYYNFIQSRSFLNAAEASNLNSFLHENSKIQNESHTINGNFSSNNIYSMEATENQNLDITDPTILNILSTPDANERRQKLIEYEKKLLPGFEETSEIANLKQWEEFLKNF